ncbi:Clp protease N-terminal domain-containing protein, partial [Streptomyces sp. NPDC049952]
MTAVASPPHSGNGAGPAKELGDDYLSTEHLLIAVAAKGGRAGEIL